MSVTYITAVKTARMQAVIDAIGSGGKLEIGTSGMAAVLFTVALNNPAGVVAGATLTFSGFPKSQNATATGTAAAARIRTSANADVVTGLTVGLAGSNADIILDSVSITNGQGTTISSASITHAA